MVASTAVGDTSLLADGTNLKQNVQELQASLAEQERIVQDSCRLLEGTAESLETVHERFQPLKARSTQLALTSSNVNSCVSTLSKLINSSKSHEKLERASKNVSLDHTVEALLRVLHEVVDANKFLSEHQHLNLAQAAHAANRKAIAYACQVCTGVFDRAMKAHSKIPTGAKLQDIMAKPPSDRPKAVDVFFTNKSKQLKYMRQMLESMAYAEDTSCLSAYVAARKHAVTTMMQLVAGNVLGSIPAAAKQERKIHEWTSQLRMLAQVLDWEGAIAADLLAESQLSRALDWVLSAQVNLCIDSGYRLASGRVSPERLFLLAEMVICMHDPYVLPSMKKAFKIPALRHMKEKFHALLSQLCVSCQHCVTAFLSELAKDGVQLGKSVAEATSVAQQTAFTIRFLKCLFRKELEGKLPFLMQDTQNFATATVQTLVDNLEKKLINTLKDGPAVSLAMLNNTSFILAGVEEHDALPTVMGSAWLQQYRTVTIPHWRAEYVRHSWHSLLSMLQQAIAEANPTMRKEAAKENCKRVNVFIDRILTTQSPWPTPEARTYNRLIEVLYDAVLPGYRQFWTTYSDNSIHKGMHKQLKYSPDELQTLIGTALFSGTQFKPKK